jgi:hypothetical protein
VAIFNTEVMREPLNWLTVFLMCAFALLFIGLIFPDQAPASTSS